MNSSNSFNNNLGYFTRDVHLHPLVTGDRNVKLHFDSVLEKT